MATFQRADNKKKNNDNVLKELRNLFGNVLHVDVIKSVASTYQYDIHRSSNVLLEMTSNVQEKSPKKKNKPKKQLVPNNTPKKTINPPPRIQPSASANTIANKSKKAERIEQTVDDIGRGYKVLVLLRGLPGSGKSSLGKALTEATLGQGVNDRHVFSTDDYFSQQGSYVYDPSKLSDAHLWNHNRAFSAMSHGLSPVIIDNTNVQMWEMKPYATMATDYGYIIHILEPDTWWCLNDKELAKRNKHKVPRQKIKEMIDRYEKNVTTQKLLSAYGLVYKFQKPPQFRLVPPLHAHGNFQNGFIPSAFSCNNAGFVKSRSTSVLNRQKSEESNSDLVGNFMDFNDDFPQPSTFNHATAKASSSSNLIDDLMGHESDSSDILQPTPVTEDDDKERTLLDNAWGINLEALHSWDLAISVDDEASTIREPPQVPVKSETADGCSNVEISDFRFLDCNSKLPDGFKAVEAHCRDINEGSHWQNLLEVRKKSMVDKSSLTDDVVTLDNRTDDVKLKELKNLFPGIGLADLRELYEKCHKDFNWTVNVLLDDNHVVHGNEEPETTTSSSQKSEPCIESRKVSQNNDGLYTERPGVSGRNEGWNMDPHPSRSTVDLYSSDSDNEDDNCKGMVELNLGDAFVAQLETKFGNGDWKLPQGYQPVVQVPVGLARQLYAFYVESIFQQMEAQSHILDSLVKVDEEFARKLQAQEQARATPTEPNQITNEAINVQEVSGEWKNLTADTLAMKLTRQKLFNTFPGVQQETLTQLFLANNNNYHETVTEVFVSLGQNISEIDEAITQPPLTQTDMEEMKVAESGCQNFEESEEPEPATFYREQANKHLENHEALYQKAQSYYQKGLTEVAMFYSDLAKKETRFYDRANHLAATTFLEEHSQRLQKFDTLDLHYLYVKEALPALDLFIDRGINLLQGGNKKMQELFVITGRGNRSEGGVSKIKPAVITRLKRRNIQFVTMNPGLLKIWVSKHSCVTSDLS